MKYVVDLDALKDCIDLLELFKINGRDAVYVHNVKLLIDKFPKEALDIPKLLTREVREVDS